MCNKVENGQNSVATSALKNAVVKAVKMIDKAEYAKVGYVNITNDMRLSFDGSRFIRDNKDNFIFNGRIRKKCSNGRYDHYMVEIHYKNLDNNGLCLNDMVNGVLDAILANIDNWIINYYKSESITKWEAGLELYQNFRNEYFGSRLVVDNTEDLNNPNASDEPDGFINLEKASEQCDNNMMACVDKYGQVFIDAVIKEYEFIVIEEVNCYDLDDTIKYCVKGALDYLEYDSEKEILVGCSVVPDLDNWNDEDEFCEYFRDAYGFDLDSCLEFYEEYCDDMMRFSDKYYNNMEDALKDFDKESVFDKIPFEINWDGEYIEISIEMDDFVNYIKKNNVDKAQLFKYNDMWIDLYNMSSKSEDIKEFFNDLYKDMTDMTIREFYDLNSDFDEPINYEIDKFLNPGDVEMFKNFVKKLEDAIFYITEDADGDLYVAGNEYFCLTYFDDDVPMAVVYSRLIRKMNYEILRLETEIENEIEKETKYKVLDAFECGGDFNVEYDEWWDYVLEKTPDWIIDKYFDKFCDVLYGYFVQYAKDYGYVVEKLDDGIYLKKSK